MEIFSTVRKLDQVKGWNRVSPPKSARARKRLDNQLRKLEIKLARSGYTADQPLHEWAIYVEFGLDALNELTKAKEMAADGTDDSKFNNFKQELGISDIPFDCKIAKGLIKKIPEDATIMAARYMALEKKPDLTEKEESEKKALSAQLRGLSIDVDQCGRQHRYMDWALILKYKNEVSSFLSKRDPRSKTHATLIADAAAMQAYEDSVGLCEDYEVQKSSHKGTRHPKKVHTVCIDRTRATDLERLGITMTDPKELKYALDAVTAKGKKSRRGRPSRRATTKHTTIATSPRALNPEEEQEFELPEVALEEFLRREPVTTAG